MKNFKKKEKLQRKSLVLIYYFHTQDTRHKPTFFPQHRNIQKHKKPQSHFSQKNANNNSSLQKIKGKKEKKNHMRNIICESY